ncbi:MAG: Elongation factor Ts [Parcubacteria group bacterium ADurb.Bin316]|nr:MAG: Elongation factor Ts [Parcubacteria group bacterium ADurb.Bin316]HOZ56311.1 translation elongation factor Ts [bacterium]
MENIKELRDKTGAGIIDCKKALEESGGDIAKAVEILRKKGIAKAAKRSEREASEGVIKILVNENGSEAYILEVNAETDFVARNEKFQDFANQAIEAIKANKPGNLDELLNLTMADSTVGEGLKNLSSVIGEKLEIRRFDILAGETVAAYSHMGGRIGVIVAIDKKDAKDLAYDLAMQIAAANPRYITSDEVPSEEIGKEKEVYREQLLKEGKPENMIDKIMEGKLNKYFDEICLVGQDYIKDDKKKVRDILGDVKVTKFIRYSL